MLSPDTGKKPLGCDGRRQLHTARAIPAEDAAVMPKHYLPVTIPRPSFYSLLGNWKFTPQTRFS